MCLGGLVWESGRFVLIQIYECMSITTVCVLDKAKFNNGGCMGAKSLLY